MGDDSQSLYYFLERYLQTPGALHLYHAPERETASAVVDFNTHYRRQCVLRPGRSPVGVILMARRRRSERYDVRKVCWHCGVGKMTRHGLVFRCNFCGATITQLRLPEASVEIRVSLPETADSAHSSRERELLD